MMMYRFWFPEKKRYWEGTIDDIHGKKYKFSPDSSPTVYRIIHYWYTDKLQDLENDARWTSVVASWHYTDNVIHYESN